MSLSQTIKGGIDKVKTYWKTPMVGRYMTFREIAAYAGGGIGAYMLITLGTAGLLSTGNTLISSTLGVDATHMYILYVIAVLANIPLTGIRANIIDNTRNKAGKYRPYIVSMGIPTAIICVAMVWFPYDKFGALFGHGQIFGEDIAYVVKCTVILIFNLLLHFFYYFFYDGYENLIHVLSPNTQERADVASIKSVVYSLAPTLVNLFTPIIAQNIFHTNTTDIRVYRLLYPILGVLGILLCIIVYKYTEEKIVQARSHVVQIKFMDALRAVAKNKYFWIISLAGWLGFLETAYANLLFWLYNYGGACSGNQYGLIVTLYGNASLWGMLAAPICIRKWGKKAVLVVTNLMNVAFILAMLLFIHDVTAAQTIWLVMLCLWFNALMGSFAHILNPTIQADIRDYQQYKTGERIDGMFSAVATIGTVITLATSSVLPIIYEKGGLTKENAKLVTSNPEILNRMLGDGKTVGQILQEQLANGQNNYENSFSALYDPSVLSNLIIVLVIVAGVGAFLNVVPYFWYDFNEKKQQSVVRVLKIRALFEDYGNGIVDDGKLVETIDIIHNARELQNEALQEVSKKDYKSIQDKDERKAAKKAYKEALKRNLEIEISQFVCAELDKFQSKATQQKLAISKKILSGGLEGVRNLDIAQVKADLATAKAMPKTTQEEKDLREFFIDTNRSLLSANAAIHKFFKDEELVQPDFSVLEKYFDIEDECDVQLKTLYLEKSDAKKAKDKAKLNEINAKIKELTLKKKVAQADSKAEMDKHAHFNRAAKPYLDAEKMIKQEENYSHFEEIAAMYDESKARHEEALAMAAAEAERIKAEEKAHAEQIKAEKAAKKAAKKNK